MGGGGPGREEARQVAAGAGEVIGKGARVVQDKADEGHWVEKAQDQAQKVTKSAKQYARPEALPPHLHPKPKPGLTSPLPGSTRRRRAAAQR